MADQNEGGNLDKFEVFFKRADLDHDGRITGHEAVSFFQGSGLSKQVLAQIWMHADQNRAGFLGRQEFYNALKLVTVAQSKRDLSPEIVKAALYGPASAKIPPPQISLPPSPAPQTPSVPSSPPMQMRPMGPTGSQSQGYRGPVPPSPNMNQHYYPSQANQLVRPSQGPSVVATPRPMQSVSGLAYSGVGISPTELTNSGMRPSFSGLTPNLSSSGLSTLGFPSSGMSNPGLSNSGISTGWLDGKTSGAPSGPTFQLPSGGTSPSMPLDLFMSSQAASQDSKGTPISRDGFSSNSIGDGDPFAAFQLTKSGSSPAISSMSNNPNSSVIVPLSSAPTQPLSASRSLDSLQNAFAKQPSGGQQAQTQNHSKLSPHITETTSSGASPGVSAGAGFATSDPSQPPWPKMSTPGVQKYTKVFMEVDTDRDGKITGEQARNLFLSWRLPREVLKQVWDLADQDNDSMLSLREFCIALYFMERYREGRSLPPSLPDSIKFDETLMRMVGLPPSSHAGWGPASNAGFRPPVQGMSGSQPMAPAVGLNPITQSPETDMTMQLQQQKPRMSVLDNSLGNQHGDEEHSLLQPSHPETKEAEKKADKIEKVYLDSREKLEYYRSKMQELVLYKSRCDNRLNEIIERASADKREAGLLGKKYEDKYKQVAEIASMLTIEEAKFREYQERKMELQKAITNMEQGGSADGILQVRADRIQSDFEELLKAMSERCKKHGFEIKSAALIELPKGWQPGIQEGASVWDEEWDKFEDEGLLFDKEVGVGTQNANTSPKSTLFENGTFPHDDLFDPDSPTKGDTNSEKQSNRGEAAFDGEYRYNTHSEDDSPRSPHHRTPLESPSQDFSDVFARSSEGDTDFHRSFDDQGWGNFDGTDDVDSVWGGSKDQQVDRLFDSSGFGSSPRNDSPQGGNSYNTRSPFHFEDSVPATPSFSNSVNSPRYSEAGDSFFNNYSTFDSFNMNESSRFESVSSSRDEFGGHSRGFTSFDDQDPFGSTGPFKESSETPKKSSDHWSSF